MKPKENAPKKAKKNKKKDKKPAPQSDAEDDNEVPNDIAEPGEDVEGNDDIASDFEFTVGEDTGFVEDFDGWGNDLAVQVQEKGSTKSTAVDIDEIIERRNKKKAKTATEEAVEEEENEDAFEGFEDDELLAEDGFGMGAESEDDEEEDSDTEGDSDAESNEEEYVVFTGSSPT